MILLAQYIELRIYHLKEWRKYNVIELIKNEDEVSYKIFHNEDYIFTLIPKKTTNLSFELSDFDMAMDTIIDWGLYSKIEASLFSIFLKEPLS
jgi:hypothetical protein